MAARGERIIKSFADVICGQSHPCEASEALADLGWWIRFLSFCRKGQRKRKRLQTRLLWYSILIFPESVGGSGHPIPGGSLDSFVRVTTGESPTTRQSHGKLSSPSQNWNPANVLQVSGVCLLQLSVGQQKFESLRLLETLYLLSSLRRLFLYFDNLNLPSNPAS